MFSLFKLAALASILGAVSAVDIGLWDGSTCTGSLQVCSNIPARTCCTPPITFNSRSAQFVNKPATATAVLYFRSGSNACATAFATSNNGVANLCVNPPVGDTRTFAGAAFFPAAVKRAPGVEACEASVNPDTLVLADGTRINIQGMAADQVDAIMRLSSGPSYGASLPQVYGDLA